MPDESKEDVANDLDDFEARLEGRSSGAKGGPSSKKSANRPVPKSNVPPMFVPKAYNKVQKQNLTEEQEDQMEAIKAVSELDKFEARLPASKDTD
eukprot:CAMPEP_0184300374 /NCGR_PEP_ID=MMETSP1049-20130417/10798_1 /TAXON_ID=77928 /ORGANISM="Proteomonas sulcata, Strain CCMP704" /LENGTH=94 /DNA_ID=CAMNT_0026611073 /DNA_START=109 /DNA_END=393 /DNA_ORIENTATION=-